MSTDNLTRGQRIWQRTLDLRSSEPVSLERARLLTASWKQTDGLPIPIRRAKAFEKIVTEIPISIEDDQLLAGSWSSRLAALEWHPEHTARWVKEELENGQFPYPVNADEIDELKEISSYWHDKNTEDVVISTLGDQAKKVIDESETGAWIFAFRAEVRSDKGWFCPDYEKAIRLGFSGVLSEIEDELKNTAILDDKSYEKTVLLEALIIDLKASINYIKRQAILAAEKSKTAQGTRKLELEEMAKVCEWTAENPARTFKEALQIAWLLDLFIWFDTHNLGAIALGRVDQYLYPYFKQDIQTGILTRDEAVELLECLRCKLSSMRVFREGHRRTFGAGEAQFHNCTLGGVTPDGQDAVNELSYLWLEAAFRARTPHPTLSIRWHENLNEDFALKAIELDSLGMGYPAWFSDKSTIPWFLKIGASLEEARDYQMSGCVVHTIPHKTAAVWPVVLNMPKILEIALNDGKDPRTGKMYGLKTGKFEDFNTFGEFYEAYKKQTHFFNREGVSYSNKAKAIRASYLPQIFVSAFVDDCIKRGKTQSSGGARYQQGYSYFLPVGVIDVADSLAAIKKLIFEERKISKKELMEALAVNFKGKEELRRLLLSVPKYGNDDDFVDFFAADIYKWLRLDAEKIDALNGAKWCVAPHSLSFHSSCGLAVGALPSGREAGVSLADGGVSPCQGMDEKGPTAIINSASKIDHTSLLGSLFNMKFHPSALKTKEDQKKLLALIKTYFNNGGKHIQFNVVSRETLQDAQSNPERHRGLLVRVAGYSAIFIELGKSVQNEIIARSEKSWGS